MFFFIFETQQTNSLVDDVEKVCRNKESSKKRKMSPIIHVNVVRNYLDFEISSKYKIFPIY